ncbi:unnamed protein product [Strongylus vulgaris]|uniref:Uncharacterized protein n=1 Tax=Strongylus vulgaris TaxID=40348 RepID=A0A3P7IYF9_STRVU|nr:unnamed protein product [Strongylus vulgaris]
MLYGNISVAFHFREDRDFQMSRSLPILLRDVNECDEMIKARRTASLARKDQHQSWSISAP